MSIIQSEKLELSSIGIKDDLTLHRNLSVESLVGDIISNNEGVLSSTGAAIVDTGKYTGRSPQDKYIVDEDSSSDNIWWGNVNQKISEEIFDELYNEVVDYFNSSESKTYLFDGFAGADSDYDCHHDDHVNPGRAETIPSKIRQERNGHA